MENISNKDDGEHVMITYIENIIDEGGFIRNRSKDDSGMINHNHGLINRVSDLLNNADHFLEYTNSYGTDSILSKDIIQCISVSLKPEIEMTDYVNVSIEMTNGLKFFGWVDLCGTVKVKHVFENKSFIPLIQVNINRTLLINRKNIRRIEIQKMADQ